MKTKTTLPKLLYAIPCSDYDIQEQECHECPEDSGAAFVERWDNFPRRVFYDLDNAIGMDNGIMDNALTPSVAIGYAVAIDNALTIHGVRPLPLTDENTIAGVNAIARNEGTGRLTEIAVRAKQQGVRCGSVKASA